MYQLPFAILLKLWEVAPPPKVTLNPPVPQAPPATQVAAFDCESAMATKV